MDNTQTQLDPDAVNLAKAIRQTESGGNFTAKGKSGEYGAYQFTEPTWKAMSSKYGVNAPLNKATSEQQNEVAYRQVKEWKDKGYNPGQIASMWNSGKPDAYLDSTYKGTNKSGAKYDVPAYAKSVATAYQAIKKGGQVQSDPNNPSSTANQTPTEQPKRGFLSTVAHGLIDPVATIVARPFQVGAELLGASPEAVDKFSKDQLGGFVAPVPQNASDVVKDVGRAAQTVAFGMPVGTLGGAIKAGAVMGAGGGLEQNPSIEGATTGGLLGAGLGLGGGLVSKALGAIPKSLVSSAFKDLSPAEIEKALQTKTIGTSNNLLQQSRKAVADYGNQIDKLLTDSKKVGIGGIVGGGSGNDAIRQTITQFPEYNSDKGVVKMLTKIKSLLSSSNSGVADRGTIVGLIDKINKGTATLKEKNLVRSAIDSATKGGYTKLAKALNPNAGHDLAMTFADNLRGEVQNWVPETQPIFAEFAKEMGFKNAVNQAINKGKTGILGWNDIVPFMLGNNLGGLPGGLAGVAIEKGAKNPAIQFGLAKGIQGLGKVVKPIANRTGLVSGVIQK